MRYSLLKKAAVATLFITQTLAFPQGRGSENDERTLDLPTPEEAAAGLGLLPSNTLPSTSIIQILPNPTTLAIATQKPTPTSATTHKLTSTPNASHKELHREARALAKLASTESLAVVMRRAAIWVFESTKTAIS